MVRAVKVVPLAEEGYAGPRSFGGSGGSGRRVMGKVPSLVFDLDDDAEAAPHAAAEHVEDVSVAEVKQKLQTLLEPWSEPEYMLLLHARFAREDCAKRGHPLTVPELADTLRRLGYAVKMRTALGGGSGGACLRSLRHSFLTVAVSGPSGSMTYLLDPRFKEQFEIAHTTARYARVLEAVGPEVVTSADRLARVVELLCGEMAAAFAESGTPLPPWRQHAAMISKWQPRRSEEVDLPAALNNGAGLLAPLPPPGGCVGPPPGARRLTGPSTVAQRLAMLGVAQQQSNPSPIAEGLEAGSGSAAEEEDGWEGLGLPSSTASSSTSSLHLGWDEGAHEPDGGTPPAAPQHPIPAPAPRGKSIFESIRARAAALPHRRNSTWAG